MHPCHARIEPLDHPTPPLPYSPPSPPPHLDGVLDGDIIGLEVPADLVLAAAQGPADRQAGGLALQVVAGLIRELAVIQSQLDVGDLGEGGAISG